MGFDALLNEADQTPFEGWDFSVFGDRLTEESPSWDYRDVISPYLDDSTSLLDMGTGGGEFLASLTNRPSHTTATEGWEPNIPVAKAMLEPLGITVVGVDDEENAELPFSDSTFDLVINRHESFTANEVHRILKPGGIFITQQVGGRDLAEINEALDANEYPYAAWDLDAATKQLDQAGFTILDNREEHLSGKFSDIGAVALFLRVAPWHVPDFSPKRYRSKLKEIHDNIVEHGPFEVFHHRFLLVAQAT